MLTLWNDLDRTFTTFDEMRRRMDRLFDEYASGEGAEARGARGPRMTLSDEGGQLVLSADLPGMTEKDLQITLNQDLLTLAGERKLAAPEGYAAHRREREPVRFTRSVVLPCKVDAEKTVATFKDGVLRVELGKAAEERPRQIQIKAS